MTGSNWMKETVSFHKVKLTNNHVDKSGLVREEEEEREREGMIANLILTIYLFNKDNTQLNAQICTKIACCARRGHNKYICI
jgi:hypothetical protein